MTRKSYRIADRQRTDPGSGGQLSLFGDAPRPNLPEGFGYRRELIGARDAAALADHLVHLPFRAFEFHGFLGNRRTVSFGWHYAFDGSGLRLSEAIPDWLLPVRAEAAAMAEIAPDALEHVLVTEYAPGAGIGWHRDRSVFQDVLGVSLLAPARLRFRRRCGERWERGSLEVEPRSLYVLRGPAREQWEHSIPAMETLRYSITFRTLRSQTQE